LSKRKSTGSDRLQGWKEIARFLGQPIATAQHWGKTGMPVEREGRYTVASRDKLSAWLGKESRMGAPAHIPTKGDDLAAELKRGLQLAKSKRQK
jgi:hypothetical protein